MKCHICNETFMGRANRRYCSIRCRRKAEDRARVARRDQQWQVRLGQVSGAERELMESAAAGTRWLEENALSMEEAMRVLFPPARG